MDKFSLKDSGRGDSEAGDSDYDLGRESPIDRLLGEGFSDLFLTEGHQRMHPGKHGAWDAFSSTSCWILPRSHLVPIDLPIFLQITDDKKHTSENAHISEYLCSFPLS